MNFETGMFVRSLAGHDKNKLYVISGVTDDYIYVVDGKIRTVNCPKKKKRKHLQIDNQISELIKAKLVSGTALQDEDIKRAIKLKDI